MAWKMKVLMYFYNQILRTRSCHADSSLFKVRLDYQYPIKPSRVVAHKIFLPLSLPPVQTPKKRAANTLSVVSSPISSRHGSPRELLGTPVTSPKEDKLQLQQQDSENTSGMTLSAPNNGIVAQNTTSTSSPDRTSSLSSTANSSLASSPHLTHNLALSTPSSFDNHLRDLTPKTVPLKPLMSMTPPPSWKEMGSSPGRALDMFAPLRRASTTQLPALSSPQSARSSPSSENGSALPLDSSLNLSSHSTGGSGSNNSNISSGIAIQRRGGRKFLDTLMPRVVRRDTSNEQQQVAQTSLGSAPKHDSSKSILTVSSHSV
eukprot:gene25794-32286_t